MRTNRRQLSALCLPLILLLVAAALYGSESQRPDLEGSWTLHVTPRYDSAIDRPGHVHTWRRHGGDARAAPPIRPGTVPGNGWLAMSSEFKFTRFVFSPNGLMTLEVLGTVVMLDANTLTGTFEGRLYGPSGNVLFEQKGAVDAIRLDVDTWGGP